MEQLKKFLGSKINNIKTILDIEHSLNILVEKSKFYKGTPNQTEVMKDSNVLIEEFTKLTQEINSGFDFTILVQKHIAYQIKYNHENKYSDLNKTIEEFTKELHLFINLVSSTLTKCRVVTTVNMPMINNCNTFIGSINPKSIKKIESLIVELGNLQKKWNQIIKEEKDIEEAEKTLARDAAMWRKYKHLINSSNTEE